MNNYEKIMAELDKIDVLLAQWKHENAEANKGLRAAIQECRDNAAAVLETAENLYGKPYPKAHGY